MSRLFSVTVIFFVAIISIAMIAVLLMAVLSAPSLQLMSHTDGVAAVSGGFSERWLRLVFLLAVLLSVCFLYWRNRKSR